MIAAEEMKLQDIEMKSPVVGDHGVMGMASSEAENGYPDDTKYAQHYSTS
jgi:hypothetical protein